MVVACSFLSDQPLKLDRPLPGNLQETPHLVLEAAAPATFGRPLR